MPNSIKKILIAGGPGSLIYREVKEASLLKKYLVEIGFNETDIITDSLSDNTHENAVNSARIAKELHPNGNYLLITSAFHMRRAKACFKKEGLILDIYSTNPYGKPRKWDFESLFIPSFGALAIWDRLFHEIIGYFAYALSGYV